MDTLTKSCSPTIVITANGEVQSHEEATVYAKELDIFLTMKVFETVKNHISLKTVFEYSATRRTSFRSWVFACQRVFPPVFPLQHQWHLQSRRLIILRLPQVHLPHQLWLCQVTVRIEQRQTCVRQIPIQHLCQVHMLNGKYGATRWPSQPKIQNQIKTKTTRKNGATRRVPIYWNGCKNSEKILWMTEFLERRDSHASSSHEPSLEPTPTRSVDLGKHSVYTHFPKDRQITRAPCRRRIGGAESRAENFCDLITADHKVHSEGCESRNNHRHGVVVQDLATQWIQPYRAKQKLLKKPREACKSSGAE